MWVHDYFDGIKDVSMHDLIRDDLIRTDDVNESNSIARPLLSV